MAEPAQDPIQPPAWRGENLEARRAELASLRGEIVVRVIFQNGLLCLCWVALGGILLAGALMGRGDVFAIYGILATAAAAMWAHHGARTAQIRAYLQTSLEPALNPEARGGWEHALARMHFESVLGTRWAVSTKGFFVGSELVCGIGTLLLGGPHWALAVIGVAVAATIWLVNEPPLRTDAR